MVENSEAHDGVEAELAVFITHGSAIWIRQSNQNHDEKRQKWDKPTKNVDYQGQLTILIANIMEENEVKNEPGKQQNHEHAPDKNGNFVYSTINSPTDV